MPCISALPLPAALCLSVVLLASCGVTVRPHTGTGDDVPRPGMPAPGDAQAPAPPSRGPTSAPDARPDVDRICRSTSVPRGWIAVAYEAAPAGQCLGYRGEQGFAVAVIERHDRKPVGSIMIVCADQPIPRSWMREHPREPLPGCEGARVRSGNATSYAIRRL
jgi:hypothetical protein